MHLEIELAQLPLKNDKQKIKAQKGGLTPYKQKQVQMCCECQI